MEIQQWRHMLCLTQRGNYCSPVSWTLGSRSSKNKESPATDMRALQGSLVSGSWVAAFIAWLHSLMKKQLL